VIQENKAAEPVESNRETSMIYSEFRPNFSSGDSTLKMAVAKAKVFPHFETWGRRAKKIYHVCHSISV
jgi:hypothetical protein